MVREPQKKNSLLRSKFVVSQTNDDDPLKEALQELIHYATMAPSSHNTQCWRFRISRDDVDNDKKPKNAMDTTTSTITVLPDFERRCPVVDPDDHHLFATIGCAVENLVIAAQARGFQVLGVDSTNPADGVHIQLKRLAGYDNDDKSSTDPKATTDLFEAIPKRQVSRCEYDGKPLSEDELSQLEKAGSSTDLTSGGARVRVMLVTDRDKMNEISDQIVRANSAQLADSNFKKEVVTWVRFNEQEAMTRGDGLYGKCMGSPEIPTMLGKLIFNFVTRPSTEGKKIAKNVGSSAGFAVFVSERDDPCHWVEAGRCYERFALRATILGVRNAFLNQPVEATEPRARFSAMMHLNESERPDFIVRFGKGPEMPLSPRRPMEDVVMP
jgi:nitroreductase